MEVNNFCFSESPPSREGVSPTSLCNTNQQQQKQQQGGAVEESMPSPMTLLRPSSMDDIVPWLLRQGVTPEPIRKIMFVSNYPPRRCGIASFTKDLRQSTQAFLQQQQQQQQQKSSSAASPPRVSFSCVVCAVNDGDKDQEGVLHDYPKEVVYEFRQSDPLHYHRLADFVNRSNVDVVCLQHEYGIYGGENGEHILRFLRDVRVPVVTTLHTVLEDPTTHQRQTLAGVICLSSAVVAMTSTALSLLERVYKADMKRVTMIAPGVPSAALLRTSSSSLTDAAAAAVDDTTSSACLKQRRLARQLLKLSSWSCFGSSSKSTKNSDEGAAAPPTNASFTTLQRSGGCGQEQKMVTFDDSLRVVLSFGLLSPNKGFESMIEAMSSLINASSTLSCPSPLKNKVASTATATATANMNNILYVIVGQTHPNVVRLHGESYRNNLQWRAQELGIAGHVHFVNRFVDDEELRLLIAAADVVVTPFHHEAQITSGTLTLALGLGAAVVSTPYWHARDMITASLPSANSTAGGSGTSDPRGANGVLVPFRNAFALAQAVHRVLRDDAYAQSLRDRALASTRHMEWPLAAESYMSVFDIARRAPICKRDALNALVNAKLLGVAPNFASSSGAAVAALPQINVQHLRRMTDDVGLIQFANFVIPEYNSGYCTDDNARSLTVALKMQALGMQDKLLGENGALDLGTIYLSFIMAAFNRSTMRFQNFMGYDRRWADPLGIGSEESHGRAMQCLGHCCKYNFYPEVAKRLFLDGIPVMYTFSSPRSLGHAMDGAAHYLAVFKQDAPVVAFLKYGAEKLMAHFTSVTRHNASLKENWLWFEEYLTYSNPSLSMAMIAAGEECSNKEWTTCGLTSLRWLFEIQLYHVTDTRVVFSPIGCFAAQLRGDALRHPQHDQQPIEASTFVLAALLAFRVTGDVYWKNAARMALDWFLSLNCVGEALYDSETGGTRDGLHPTGTNCNQGAESMLAFLLALTEWKEMELLVARGEIKVKDSPLLRE